MDEELRDEAIRRVLQLTEDQAEQLLRLILESDRAYPGASEACCRPST